VIYYGFRNEPKPHGDLENGLQKLEELKLNRQYADLMGCVDSAITFIQDPTNTLSSNDKFIRLLVAQLFTEPYLLQQEFLFTRT
jgi:hypothetical protein